MEFSKTLIVLFCFLTVPNLFAQEPLSRAPANTSSSIQQIPFYEGTFEDGLGSWVCNMMSPSLGKIETSDKSPHQGTKCVKITIDKVASEIWHVQLVQRHFSVKKNMVYKLRYSARGERNAGTLEVAFVKASPPWSFYGAKKIKVTPVWQEYEMLFTAPQTTNDIQVAFQCAHKTGDYYIDDISFVPVGILELKELPNDWYEKAEQRIDSIRKADLLLQIIDSKGNPVKGIAEVRLLKHQFGWGTCLSFSNSPMEETYKKAALKHFNCGVFENAFKWEEYESDEGKPNYADIDKYLKWGEKNDFPIRGHTLIWGTENYGYDHHWSRLKDDGFLRKSIYERITRDLTRYKGRIREYDVWNEPIHEPSLFSRLGADILDSAFIWAHKTDPDAKLYINEYSIISGGDAKVYRDMINDLIGRGIPVQGIGVQGHFSSRIEPLEIASKLYYMGQTGLPIKITEFDMDATGLGLSEKDVAADYAKMMRTAFSHPSVEGFLFWGFWDGRHWRSGAGIYDQDFKPKAAADSVYNLIHKIWTTSEILKTDSSGKCEFRGFSGKYEIKFKSEKGKKKTFIVDLSGKDKNPVILNLNAKNQ